jgi:hypothetical protein
MEVYTCFAGTEDARETNTDTKCAQHSFWEVLNVLGLEEKHKQVRECLTDN